MWAGCDERDRICKRLGMELDTMAAAGMINKQCMHSANARRQRRQAGAAAARDGGVGATASGCLLQGRAGPPATQAVRFYQEKGQGPTCKAARCAHTAAKLPRPSVRTSRKCRNSCRSGCSFKRLARRSCRRAPPWAGGMAAAAA